MKIYEHIGILLFFIALVLIVRYSDDTRARTRRIIFLAILISILIFCDLWLFAK